MRPLLVLWMPLEIRPGCFLPQKVVGGSSQCCHDDRQSLGSWSSKLKKNDVDVENVQCKAERRTCRMTHVYSGRLRP